MTVGGEIDEALGQVAVLGVSACRDFSIGNAASNWTIKRAVSDLHRGRP